MKKITISQTLSAEFEIPDNIEESDEEYVRENIMLPSDCCQLYDYFNWIEDDFCIVYE